MTEGVEIIIGSDVCPTPSNFESFSNANVENPFNDLTDEFRHSDLNIINLECPLIRETTPIAKCGPVLGAPVDAINALKSLPLHVANLANNHILDHGSRGLDATLKACQDAGIRTVGAGVCLDEAKIMLSVKIKGMSIGIMSMAEHEFSIATEDSAGANPLDLITFREYAKRFAEFDYRILLYHGGNEYYPYPSPQLMRMCRHFADEGVDLIVVQHTHCPGCWEEYNGSHIFYGQGNLLFDKANKPVSWYEGYLIRLRFNGKEKDIELIPYEQSKGFSGVRKMHSNQAEPFLLALNHRSEQIKDPNVVKELWQKWCEDHMQQYLNGLLSYNKVLGMLNRNGIITKLLSSKSNLLKLQNYISCESHREAVITVLRNITGKTI